MKQQNTNTPVNDNKYLIIENNTGLYWNNDDGFGDKETATVFSGDETKTLNLPIGGKWIATPVKDEGYTKGDEKEIFKYIYLAMFNSNCDRLAASRLTELAIYYDCLKAENERLLHNMKEVKNICNDPDIIAVQDKAIFSDFKKLLADIKTYLP